jgi:hypothetical protein
MSITVVLLQFVTYLLTLSRTPCINRSLRTSASLATYVYCSLVWHPSLAILSYTGLRGEVASLALNPQTDGPRTTFRFAPSLRPVLYG